MTEEKRFPLEKILTISASEWFQITGKNPRDYNPIGVHSQEGIMAFQTKVPSGAEVVVSSSYHSTERGFPYVGGTALVPKYSKENSLKYAMNALDDAERERLLRKEFSGLYKK